MTVLIENEATGPVTIYKCGRKLSALNMEQFEQNKSVCGLHEFIDVADALNYVFSKAYTRRYTLDLYSEPGEYDVRITILDGFGTHSMPDD